MWFSLKLLVLRNIDMTIREQLTALIAHLPDEKLHLVWEQLNAFVLTSDENQIVENGNHAVKVDVPPKPYRRNLPPVQRRIADGQPSKVEMVIGKSSAQNQEAIQRFFANIKWWHEHEAQVRRDSALHGRYIAVSESKIYSGATYCDAKSEAFARHPTDTPYIFFLHASLEGMNNAN